jgi:hypothetical protein
MKYTGFLAHKVSFYQLLQQFHINQPLQIQPTSILLHLRLFPDISATTSLDSLQRQAMASLAKALIA